MLSGGSDIDACLFSRGERFQVLAEMLEYCKEI